MKRSTIGIEEENEFIDDQNSLMNHTKVISDNAPYILQLWDSFINNIRHTLTKQQLESVMKLDQNKAYLLNNIIYFVNELKINVIEHLILIKDTYHVSIYISHIKKFEKVFNQTIFKNDAVHDNLIKIYTSYIQEKHISGYKNDILEKIISYVKTKNAQDLNDIFNIAIKHKLKSVIDGLKYIIPIKMFVVKKSTSLTVAQLLHMKGHKLFEHLVESGHDQME